MDINLDVSEFFQQAGGMSDEQIASLVSAVVEEVLDQLGFDFDYEEYSPDLATYRVVNVRQISNEE